MRLIFIGCVESSYVLLRQLIEESKKPVGVLTKEKSDFNSDFRDLRPLCAEADIPCFTIDNINDEESTRIIKDLKPDIGFCFGWSQLIDQKTISFFSKGIIGFHPANLPMNRGRHPIIWALALGLEETASTFFMINKNADEGAIVSQKPVYIDYRDDARTLYDKIMAVAVQQEMEIIKAAEDGSILTYPQELRKGNIWRKRTARDGEIDWRMSSRCIYNLVRSLTRPYVGAHFIYHGNMHKVWKVEEIDITGFEHIEPGKVLMICRDGSVDVKTGEGGIRLIEYDSIDVKKGDYIL